jgi:hypothetical protein
LRESTRLSLREPVVDRVSALVVPSLQREGAPTALLMERSLASWLFVLETESREGPVPLAIGRP